MYCNSNEKVKWAEMTRNSVNFYAILNETLFLPYEFNGVFIQFG